MKPGELTRIEDTLRRAYRDVLAVVQRDEDPPAEVTQGISLGRPPRGAGRPGGRRRWLVPAGAGAAVAVVALVAGLVVPNAMHQAPPQHKTVAQPKKASPQPAPPGPAVAGQPMAYLAGGRSSFQGLNSVLPVNLATGRVLPPITLRVTGGLAGLLVAPNGRTLYAVTEGGPENTSAPTEGGEVVPIDTATRTAGKPVRTNGASPYGMLISPDGRTGYFMDQFQGVATFNFVTMRPGPFITIRGALEFALTPDGKTLYVVTQDTLAGVPVSGPTLSTPTRALVIPVDTASMRALPPVTTRDDTGMGRIAVAPDGRTAYLLSFQQGITGQVLTPIDTRTNTALPPIMVPASVTDSSITISPDSRSAYLYTGPGIMAIDLTTRTVRWTVKLGSPIWSWNFPQGPSWQTQTVVSPDSRTVYTHGDNNGIYRVDAATGAELAPIRMGWLSSDIAFGTDGNLYDLSGGANGVPATSAFAMVTRFDPATGAVSPPISLPDVFPGSGYIMMLSG